METSEAQSPAYLWAEWTCDSQKTHQNTDTLGGKDELASPKWLAVVKLKIALYK